MRLTAIRSTAWRCGFAAWRFYLDDLRTTGAPTRTLAAFDAFGRKFVWIGHVAAGICATGRNLVGQAILVAAGGLLALLAARCSNTRRRAAFTQGSLCRVRRRAVRRANQALAKPGWQAGKRILSDGSRDARTGGQDERQGQQQPDSNR